MEETTLQSSAQSRSLAVELLMQRTMDRSQTLFETTKKKLLSPSSGIEVVTTLDLPLASIAGLEEVKHEVIRSMQERGGFQRLLLYGACGSGKAQFVTTLASHLQWGLINLTRVKALFEWEEQLDTYCKVLAEICNEKCSKIKNFILCLNHVDFYSVSSEDHEQALVRFLENVQLSWAKSGLKLAIVGTTFKPEALSDPVVFCFNERVYFPTPNISERKQILLREIPKIWKPDHLLRDEDVDFVARSTFGIIAAGIGTLISNACRVQSTSQETGADVHLKSPLQENNGYLNNRPLNKSDFEKALQLGYSRLDESTFQIFQNFHQRFGSGHQRFMSMADREDYIFKEEDKADQSPSRLLLTHNQNLSSSLEPGKEHGWLVSLFSWF